MPNTPIVLANPCPSDMIVLCELSFLDRAHVPFNAGLLATIHAAFPKEDLCFYGYKTHIQELKSEVGHALAGSISWREIVPPVSDASYLRRFLRELRILRRLLVSLETDATARLVLTSAYPSTVLALKILRVFRLRLRPVQIILHGLSGVVGKRYRRPILRFQDMKTALTLLGNKGIHYIVLEQFICDTVVENFPLLSGKINALEHPLSPSQTELPAIDLVEPIRFGFLGLADKAKGFPLFVDMANRITAQFGKRVEFHAIGHSSAGSMTMNGINALATKPESRLMSRTAFLNGIAPLHFIILSHEATSYRLTASGVLLDAIAWGKPVISRKIPIFESIFEKHGDIGYLFTHEEDLQEILERIVQEADNSRYYLQILHLRNVRKSRHPDMLAGVYREICRKTGGQQEIA